MSEATPPPELHGVVVAHGAIASAMVDAAEQITGIRGVLGSVSNSGCDRGALEERIWTAIGDGPAVVFVDLAAGSCLIAVLRRVRERSDVRVVTGVNLAMLVDFLFHRTLPADEAAAHAAASGGSAIKVP
jgi:mannose/fructose-specific phosphotransferase system component IIA